MNTRLNEILLKLCEGIEVPPPNNDSHEKQAERLIEQLEINNYPHALISCEHLEEKGIGEDCVACQQKQYETYKSRFLSLAKEKGLADTHTLKAAFDYYHTLITRYLLTECDALLDQVYPVCAAKGSWSMFYVMAIQALAFLRFKQGRYQESLEFFKTQIDTLGPNETIYENMALAYGRLSQYKTAATCYAQAILLIRQKSLEEQRYATLLMGLSAVLDNIDDSLIVLDESMRLLKLKYDKPHSLMAKALTAMGDLHIKEQHYDVAEKCFKEAVDIFKETCGDDTPLTSNAMNKHANSLLLLNNTRESIRVFMNALSVWVKVDDISFDANQVAQALITLKHELLKDGTLHSIINENDKVIDLLQAKIAQSPQFINDLNVLCLLKFIYELHIVNKDISRAIVCCRLFKELLTQLTAANDYAVYRDNLLQETTEIIKLMETIRK